MSELVARIISILLLWIFFFILSIAACVEKPMKDTGNKKSMRFMFYSIFIISLFQSLSPIGLDKPNYISLYNTFNYTISSYLSNIMTTRLEPFFVIEIVVQKFFGGGYRLFLFINYLIPLIIIYKYVLKEEKNPVLVFSIFFTLNYFNMDMMRSFFASCIYLTAIYGLPSAKKFLLCCMTPFIHIVGILGSVMYPLMKIKKKKINVLMCVIACIALLMVIMVKDKILLEFINVTLRKDYNIFSKGGYYLISNNNLEKTFTYFITHTRKRLEFMINVIFVLLALKSKCAGDNHQVLLHSAVLGIYIYLLCFILGAESVGARISEFLSIGIFLIISDYIGNEKSKNMRSIKYAIAMMLILGFDFFVTLEYAGIDNPLSPFYLGNLF